MKIRKADVVNRYCYRRQVVVSPEWTLRKNLTISDLVSPSRNNKQVSTILEESQRRLQRDISNIG